MYELYMKQHIIYLLGPLNMEIELSNVAVINWWYGQQLQQLQQLKLVPTTNIVFERRFNIFYGRKILLHQM